MDYDLKQTIESSERIPIQIRQVVTIKVWGMFVLASCIFTAICIVVYGRDGIAMIESSDGYVIQDGNDFLMLYIVAIDVVSIVLWVVGLIVARAVKFGHSNLFKWLSIVGIVVLVASYIVPVISGVGNGSTVSIEIESATPINTNFWMTSPIIVICIYIVCFGWYTRKLQKRMKQLRQEYNPIH